MPVTIVNDVLQAKPKEAVVSTGRFLINTTVGLLGLFDPASKMGLDYDPEDFGITLAKWGCRKDLPGTASGSAPPPYAMYCVIQPMLPSTPYRGMAANSTITGRLWYFW